MQPTREPRRAAYYLYFDLRIAAAGHCRFERTVKRCLIPAANRLWGGSKIGLAVSPLRVYVLVNASAAMRPYVQPSHRPLPRSSDRAEIFGTDRQAMGRTLRWHAESVIHH